MKSLISRDSHRPRQRYSGVYHIQGAMITDADLDERSGITRDRTDNLGDDAIKDGVPATGGAVRIAADGAVSLRPGVIYADGVRGQLVASAPLTQGAPLDIFTKQADLPFGPGLPGQGEWVIYADIWERPVFPLEDPYLADAGLHGAVTGFRTRTMTQLKAAPVAALADIEAGTGAFPRIGTARLAVTPLNAEILADECDPCADVVSAEQQVANALWRLEIISIQGTPNNPTSIRIAWSEENAGEIAPATIDDELFERANKVYEYFSPISEARAGVYANAAHARLPAFVGDLGTTPAPAQDHNGQNWPFVRRWDGVATITPGTNSIASSLGGGFTLSMTGGKITLRVTAFEAVIDLANAAVVPGDYWLVEMRRHAPEAERIRLVSETPVGILHHYCTLFTVRAGTIVDFSDAHRRKLSFPPLSALPADHVGLVNNCPKLYGSAKNVQEALDTLCSISAADISFDPSCALYGDADTVQEALDALCDVNFSVDESFRLLFDWGVICGIVPKLAQPNTGKIAVTPGSYLDRSGKVVKFKGGEFDLSTLDIGSGIEFETPQAFENALKTGKVCLALAAKDGGETSIHLVPEAIAFGPKDPSFSERLKACVEQKKIVRIDELVAALPDRQKFVATKLFLTSSAGGAFHGAGRLSRAEFADAGAFSAKVVDAFSAVATEEETTVLKARVEQARAANPIGNATGQTAEIRQMQQATAVFTAFAETERERLERCFCELLFPPCPPALGRPPFFVPIACLRGFTEFPRLFLREVCGYCCRKQAMTWHALQYFIGDMRTRVAAQFARVCCREDEEQPPVRPGLAYDPSRFANLDLVRFVEDYKIANAFLDKRDRLPSEFVTRPNVNDLSVADAIKEMRGTGVEVAETIDVNDPRAFEIIQERLTGISPEELWMSRGEVRPGDKIALVAQDGVARGFVLVQPGTGRLPFEAAAKAGALAPGDLDRFEELNRLAETAKEGFASLEEKRDGLLSDIGRLKTEAGELEVRRDAAAAAVATVREQMGELQETRSKLAEAIAAATRDLAAVETNHKTLLDAMRETQPVNAVLGNDRAAVLATLAGEGIATVGDIAKLNAATIRRLEAAGVLRQGEGAELKEKAAIFIRRRPG